MKIRTRIEIFLKSLSKEKKYCGICGNRMTYFNYGGCETYVCDNCE